MSFDVVEPNDIYTCIYKLRNNTTKPFKMVEILDKS